MVKKITQSDFLQRLAVQFQYARLRVAVNGWLCANKQSLKPSLKKVFLRELNIQVWFKYATKNVVLVEKTRRDSFYV